MCPINLLVNPKIRERETILRKEPMAQRTRESAGLEVSVRSYSALKSTNHQTGAAARRPSHYAKAPKSVQGSFIPRKLLRRDECTQTHDSRQGPLPRHKDPISLSPKQSLPTTLGSSPPAEPNLGSQLDQICGNVLGVIIFRV